MAVIPRAAAAVPTMVKSPERSSSDTMTSPAAMSASGWARPSRMDRLITTRSSEVWRARTWRALSKATLPVGTAEVMSVSMRSRRWPSQAKMPLATQAISSTRHRRVD